MNLKLENIDDQSGDSCYTSYNSLLYLKTPFFFHLICF